MESWFSIIVLQRCGALCTCRLVRGCIVFKAPAPAPATCPGCAGCIVPVCSSAGPLGDVSTSTLQPLAQFQTCAGRSPAARQLTADRESPSSRVAPCLPLLWEDININIWNNQTYRVICCFVTSWPELQPPAVQITLVIVQRQNRGFMKLLVSKIHFFREKSFWLELLRQDQVI